MALSKSSRILILLAIDSVFFLLELVVGEWSREDEMVQLANARQVMRCTLSLSLPIPFTWSVHTKYYPRTHVLISHQLNDVLSLCVGLWAVKVANQKTNSKMYTYGVSNSIPALLVPY